ncbi:MAG: hypothetical protein EZS28_048479, partial [Streblomastix strix]
KETLWNEYVQLGKREALLSESQQLGKLCKCAGQSTPKLTP